MAPSPSPDRGPDRAPDRADVLFDLADASIRSGLEGRRAALPRPEALPETVRRPAGAFVTLTVDEALNGCIGSIDPVEALGVTVARHAWSAAFADPRLPALSRAEYERVDIEISVLSPLEELTVAGWGDLAEAVQPGIDGLVVAAARQRAVYLPSVWGQLPTPTEFLDQLYRKAGLPPRSWPGDLTVHRFTTESHRR